MLDYVRTIIKSNFLYKNFKTFKIPSLIKFDSIKYICKYNNNRSIKISIKTKQKD